MNDDDASRTEAPTRREYVKYGGAVVGGGLLAGCVGESDSPSSTTVTDTTSTDSAPATDGSYEVCIPNRYCTEFEAVPETWAAATPAELDMGVVLGEKGGFVAMFYPGYPTAYYEQLSQSEHLSLAVDTDAVALLRMDNGNVNIDKEFFYEADADVFLLDPNTISQYSSSWSESDTEEIEASVGPFVGHHGYHNPAGLGYDYLPMYEYFGVVADVFRARDRYEAFRQLHDNVRKRLRERTADVEKPRVAVIGSGSNPSEGTFYPTGIRTGAWGTKQFRDLDVRDAWRGTRMNDDSYTTAGYEALAEADPDVIVYQNHLASRANFQLRGTDEWQRNYVEPLSESAVGDAITAVNEGQVFPTVIHVQGPIVNLQAMELTAKQLFPDEFESDEELFDRQRVADIINGAI
jgi:iron complex transport system substrate-binding protein